MQALKAVQILCQSKKDRIVSEIYDFLRIKRKAGHKIPIPDYAIDMHTKKGKELGRGYYHFLEESSRINNIARNKDFKYLKELKKYAKRGIRP